MENTDNKGVSITSFTQQNLVDGKIQYVHGDGNDTMESFTFTVTDDLPNELTGQTFDIVINAVDDDIPLIVTNDGLTLDEGATETITSTSHLAATDADSSDPDRRPPR